MSPARPCRHVSRTTFSAGFVVPHADESAVPQFAAVGPFDERDLANQLRLHPATLLHLLGGERFAPARGFLLGQIGERAVVDDPLFELRENLVANARHESVLHLRHEDQPLLFVNADDQRIEPARARDVAADDELLRAVDAALDPRAAALAGFVNRADALSDDAFESELLHGFENVAGGRLQQRRQAQRIGRIGRAIRSTARAAARWAEPTMILAIPIQQIEGVEEDRRASMSRCFAEAETMAVPAHRARRFRHRPRSRPAAPPALRRPPGSDH